MSVSTEKLIMPAVPGKSIWLVCLSVVIGLFNAASLPARDDNPTIKEEKTKIRTDRFGDPLPTGAIARLGTLRWRHPGWPSALAFSPDGKILAAGSDDGVIRFWDPATGKEQKQLQAHKGLITSLAFCGDGQLLVSTGYDQNLRTWDVQSCKQLASFRLKWMWLYQFVAVTSDGKMVASRSDEKPILIQDIVTGKEISSIEVEGARLDGLAFSRDGKVLVISNEKALRLWDVRQRKELAKLPGKGNVLRLSPDGKMLAIGGADESIFLCDGNGSELRRLRGHQKIICSLSFSADGRTLASGSYDATIRVWDTATGTELLKVQDQPGAIPFVALSPDGKTIAVGAGNGPQEVRLWDVAKKEPIGVLPGHSSPVGCLAFSPDGQTVVSAGHRWGDRTIHLWETTTGKEIGQFLGAEEGITCAALSPDGKTLSSGCWYENAIRLWDVATGKETGRLLGYRGYFPCLAFSHNGKLLASAEHYTDRKTRRYDSVIRVWEVEKGKTLVEMHDKPLKDLRGREPEPGAMWSLRFSPDDKFLLSVSDRVKLWDSQTGGLIHRLTEHNPYQVRTAVFSPDGKTLALAGSDGKIFLWDLNAEKQVLKFPAHSKWVLSLEFSPDGRLLASGGDDSTVRLWDVANGEKICQFQGHKFPGIDSLAFSPDGKSLASGSEDTTALLWDLSGLPRRLEPANLDDNALTKLWSDLEGRDASAGYKAIHALARSGNQATDFIKTHFNPIPEPDPKLVQELIKDLDNDKFAVREAANHQLQKFGAAIVPVLRQALSGKPSLEARTRLETLFAGLQGQFPGGEHLRALRAIQVLELIGSPEARQVLEKLATGAPDALLTRDAKEAAKRLKNRQAKR